MARLGMPRAFRPMCFQMIAENFILSYWSEMSLTRKIKKPQQRFPFILLCIFYFCGSSKIARKILPQHLLQKIQIHRTYL